MHVDSVNDGAEIHICNFQYIVIIKADVENKQEISRTHKSFLPQHRSDFHGFDLPWRAKANADTARRFLVYDRSDERNSNVVSESAQ